MPARSYPGDIKEAREHAMAGHCVAVDAAVIRSPGDLSDDLIMGILDMQGRDGAVLD